MLGDFGGCDRAGSRRAGLCRIGRAARLQAFNDQLGDALNLMVNGLRSGYSVLQAMEAVSREMPPPIAGEFARVVQEVQIGLPLDQALANMLRRIKSDDLDLVVTADQCAARGRR